MHNKGGQGRKKGQIKKKKTKTKKNKYKEKISVPSIMFRSATVFLVQDSSWWN